MNDKATRKRPLCGNCENVDYREPTEEMYCKAEDGREIKLWRKHRPDWCPLIKQRRRGKESDG